MDLKEMLCIPINTEYDDYVAKVFCTRKGKDPRFFVIVTDSHDGPEVLRELRHPHGREATPD